MPGVSDLWNAIEGVMAAHETKLRFLLAGGLNTAFGLAIFPLLMLVLEPWHLHYLIVLCFSNILAINFAYLSYKLFFFRKRGTSLREYISFVSYYLIYFIINLGVLPSLIFVSGLSPVWAQTLFAIAVIVSGYFWHSRVTFFNHGDRR